MSLAAFAAVLGKDLRREGRSKDTLQAGLGLVAAFLVAALLAFTTLADADRTAAFLLWAPMLYGTFAVLGRSFAAEAESGALDLLRTAPVPLAWHGHARTLANGVLVAAVAVVSLAGIAALFAVPVTGPVIALVALGALGLTVVGTVAGGLASQARTREALLPLLLVPTVAPLLLAGLDGTRLALDGATWADLQSQFLLLAGYDVAALGAAWMLWPFVLQGD